MSLRCFSPSLYLRLVLGTRLIIVSDAHLGGRPPEVEAAFLAFLDAVPGLGDCLLINGDLFEFWFEYRRVVPRAGFHIAASLGRLRKRVPIIITGGNHDRWGGDFWRRDLDIVFQPDSVRFEIGARAVLAIHGDGITETHWSARLLHHLTRHPATIAVFRALHPDFSFRMVDKLSHALGNTARDAKTFDRAAAHQRGWAEHALAEEPDLGLLIMGHTHRAALVEVSPGRHYLNPGAWFDGWRYAVATESSAELVKFT